MKIKNVTAGKPDACAYCGATKESDGSNIDLRPYGKKGVWICFDCGMKPENQAETVRQFWAILDDNDITITGP